MSKNWKYKEFDAVFTWGEKSQIKSGEGKAEGLYPMYVCSDTEVKRYDSALFEGDALVFGTGGKASLHYANTPFAYSTDCVIAYSDQPIDYRFYYYYLRQKNMQELQKTFAGSGLQHTSKKKIGKIYVPVVGVEEQKTIVDKIEERFSEVDEGIQALNRIRIQLAVYRQAVLKDTFNRVNDAVNIESICEHITDGDHMPPPKTEEGIPFIMISNIVNNKIDWRNTAYVGREYYDAINSKRKPKKGDILYTVTGSFGIPVLVDFEKEFCFQRHIALLRPKEVVLQKYLYYALMSPIFYSQASKVATGTAQKTVGLTVLRKLSVPFLQDKHAQKSIVNEIESKLSLCDKIEKTVNKALQQAEAMKQGVLRSAFEGRL